MAQRYRWSSYRNYVGGPPVVKWVRTQDTLGEFDGNRKRYRAFVEAEKGERQLSPFDRAVAGLVLGGEAFVQGILERLKGRQENFDQPKLGQLRRQGKAAPQQLEAALNALLQEESSHEGSGA